MNGTAIDFIRCACFTLCLDKCLRRLDFCLNCVDQLYYLTVYLPCLDLNSNYIKLIMMITVIMSAARLALATTVVDKVTNGLACTDPADLAARLLKMDDGGGDRSHSVFDKLIIYNIPLSGFINALKSATNLSGSGKEATGLIYRLKTFLGDYYVRYVSRFVHSSFIHRFF